MVWAVWYGRCRPSGVWSTVAPWTEAGIAWATVAHTRKYSSPPLPCLPCYHSISRRLSRSSSFLPPFFLPSSSSLPPLFLLSSPLLSVQFNVGYDFELKKRTVKSGEGKKSVKWVTSGAMGTTHRTERIMNIRNDTENEYGFTTTCC